MAFDNIESIDTVTVNINEYPIANPGGPYEGIAGEEISFDGSASADSDGEITGYTWNFGDGDTGTGVNPAHAYSEAGTYNITLTVADDKGANSSEVVTTATIAEQVGEEDTDDTSQDEQSDSEDNDSDGEGTEDSEEGESNDQTGEEEGQGQVLGIVSNATNVIGYTDVTVDQLVKIFSDRNSTKMDKARRIAQYYIDYGKLFNLRADIVWAQMIHETGFLEYTGDVGPDQNNFAGIGATGGGVIGNSFASEELGVIAHYSHLAWYYYPEHINEYCNNQYDPRHFGTTHYRYTGDASLGHLNGRWAPGNTYTEKIILFVNQIFGS